MFREWLNMFYVCRNVQQVVRSAWLEDQYWGVLGIRYVCIDGYWWLKLNSVCCSLRTSTHPAPSVEVVEFARRIRCCGMRQISVVWHTSADLGMVFNILQLQQGRTGWQVRFWSVLTTNLVFEECIDTVSNTSIVEGEDTLILCSYILLIRLIRIILFYCIIGDKTRG